MPIKARSSIGIIIVVLWIGTMFILIRRQSDNTLPPVNLEQGTLFSGVSPVAKWQDIDEWMLIIQRNTQTGKTTTLGAAHTSVSRSDQPTTDSAFLAEFQLESQISPLLPRLFVKGAAMLDKNADLTRFYAKAGGAGMSLSATGETRQKMLYVEIVKPNDISYSRRRLTEPVSLSEVLRPSLSRYMDIKPGAKMSTPVIDPLTGQSRGQLTVRIEAAETIDVDGKPTDAYRVKTSVGDIETLMWVDADGRTLRRNLLNQIYMERTTRAQALEVAPSLSDKVEIPALDLDKFDGVPVQGLSNDDANTDNSAPFASGLLKAILG